MKNTIIKMLGVALAFTATSKAASSIQWGNLNATADQGQIAGAQEILAQNGLLLSSGSSFSLLLIQSSDNIINWNYTTLSVGAGETLLGTYSFSSVAQADGAFNRTLQPGTGDNVAGLVSGSFVYTVLLNPGVASAILDGAGSSGGPTTTLVLNGAGIGDYDTTGQSGTAPYNWVVVPEPSTYAFMGLGAVLLAVRRLRRS